MNNQFDFVQSMMNQDNLGKVMKMFPNVDMSSMTDSVRKNAEAVTAANQMIAESMQSIFKRGTESFQKNATEMFNSMKEAISAGDMEQMNQCQQKYLKVAADNNISNVKEILDITSRSAKEILDVFGNSANENLGKSFAKANSSKAAK
jgi:phasin family protein